MQNQSKRNLLSTLKWKPLYQALHHVADLSEQVAWISHNNILFCQKKQRV